MRSPSTEDPPDNPGPRRRTTRCTAGEVSRVRARDCHRIITPSIPDAQGSVACSAITDILPDPDRIFGPTMVTLCVGSLMIASYHHVTRATRVRNARLRTFGDCGIRGRCWLKRPSRSFWRASVQGGGGFSWADAEVLDRLVREHRERAHETDFFKDMVHQGGMNLPAGARSARDRARLSRSGLSQLRAQRTECARQTCAPRLVEEGRDDRLRVEDLAVGEDRDD